MMTNDPTSYDEIEVGANESSESWVCSLPDLDTIVAAYEQYFDWYTVDSPFGGRLIPPIGVPYAPHPVRFDGAMIAGVEDESLELLHAEKPYTLHGRISGKYQKRGKDWVWFESTLRDADGRAAHIHRYLVALSTLTSEQREKKVRLYEHRAEMDVAELEEYPYLPPPVVVRPIEPWISSTEVSDLGYLRHGAPLGTYLEPECVKFDWRKSRDGSELFWVHLNGAPRHEAAYNIHASSAAAAEAGLPGINVSGIQLQARIHNMMLRALGYGWLHGGKLACRFLRPAPIEDFLTVRGRLIGAVAHGDTTRLEFEVWVVTQRGDIVLSGTASGLAH